MNKHFLKRLRDNMPESLKYIASPFIRNRLIKNKEFLHYYNLLENRELLSPESIKEYQLSQLKSILIHSSKNVPYYRDLFKKISFDPIQFPDFDQIKNIPFLTREIIRNNFDKLISTKKIKNGYYAATTGGSTGLPLKFLLDYDSVYKENAFIYYYRKKNGYLFDDKTTTFRQVEFGDKLWKFNPMHNEIIFFPIKLSKLTIEYYGRKINEYKPQYLNGYLSAIWYFAKLLEECKISLDFKLKGIFLTSENIDFKQRDFIEKFFNAKSTTFYGHSERCVIAQEMIPSRYSFDPYYGYTEQIKLEKYKYSIVGTGFLNYIMPFIRYKTDDICTPENKYFSIEGKRSSIKGLRGANDEFLPSTVCELDKPIFKNIMTYQLLQKEKGNADLLIIVGEQFKSSEMEGIRDEINRQTKGIIEINIKIVENLILSPRGKHQTYISLLEE
jgi:phenylacetate-CoA ligase